MARMGNFRIDGLQELQRQLQQRDDLIDAFCRECAAELAARLLRKVKKRTPVGDYSDTWELVDDGENKFLVESDRQGGELRRSWSCGTVHHYQGTYVVEVINSKAYASYVEFGHRQTPGRYVPAIDAKLKKSWVPGRFMLTISENEIKAAAPGILERKIQRFLGGCFR